MLNKTVPLKPVKRKSQKFVMHAMQNLFIGDALAMPVHWYYRVADIISQFPGGIQSFVAAPEYHPSSIMNLHSTAHGGRKQNDAAKKQIVGEVILKGKAQYWNQSHVHYHQQMQAGENTLNAYTVLWLMESIFANDGHYSDASFLELYIKNMTSEVPQHPDTYAESYHRGFFANWIAGKPNEACGAVTHDTPSIGGLVRIGPLALYLLQSGWSVTEIQSICSQHLNLTHPDANLSRICSHYIDLIYQLVIDDNPKNVRAIIGQVIKQSTQMKINAAQVDLLVDEYVVGQVYSTACYITDSWPAVLYLAYKYCDDVEQALIANVNLGGDNVHRGAVLGFILGLASPVDLTGQLGQLANLDSIQRHIKQCFLADR